MTYRLRLNVGGLDTTPIRPHSHKYDATGFRQVMITRPSLRAARSKTFDLPTTAGTGTSLDRIRCKHADRPRNSLISLPHGEPDCNFSYAVFLLRAIVTSRNAVSAPSGLPGGSRVTSPYAPDRGQVRPMDHGIATGWRTTFFQRRSRRRLPLRMAGREPWPPAHRQPWPYQVAPPSYEPPL